MDYVLPAGGCLFPTNTQCLYRWDYTESEGESMSRLEIIHESKNVFGDTIYFIRNEQGCMEQVFECDLDHYLKQKGVVSLPHGKPYMYPMKVK